jgi:hypothetical protein
VGPWDLAIEAGIALASGVVGAGGVLWKMGRELQRIKDLSEGVSLKIEKLEKEVDEDRRQGADSWQELNRTLGRIEGQMNGGHTPPRGRLPSQGRG